MRLYHGTAASHRASIQTEGILAQDGRPVFLTSSRDRAMFFARARAAGTWGDGEDSPAGLIAIVELDSSTLRPDPFDPREPDQFTHEGTIPPGAIVQIETISFNWRWPSWERGQALADHVALERVRRSGELHWRPPTQADLAADLDAIRANARSRKPTRPDA